MIVVQELDERRLAEEQERRAMRQAAMDEAEQLAAAEGQDAAAGSMGGLHPSSSQQSLFSK